jgi:soluble lytic murein transglycosylase-like protein
MFVSAMPVSADQGKIILKNGSVLEGYIDTQSDGSCFMGLNSGFVKFEKNEIKKIIITKKEKAIKTPKVREIRNPALPKNDLTYEQLINYTAKKYGLDPALIKAVIKAESNFDPKGTSHKGACGLMQLMPETAEMLGVENIYEPGENIDAGARYLKCLIDSFNGDVEKALAAYNAGPGTIRRYDSIPPYKETKTYINKVYDNYQDYHYDNKIYTYTDESGCLNIYNVK